MAAVLLMVGRGDEAPSIVPALLDVAAVPGKPQYLMASEEPLLLFECGYREGTLPPLRRTAANHAVVRGQLEEQMER